MPQTALIGSGTLLESVRDSLDRSDASDCPKTASAPGRNFRRIVGVQRTEVVGGGESGVGADKDWLNELVEGEVENQ